MTIFGAVRGGPLAHVGGRVLVLPMGLASPGVAWRGAPAVVFFAFIQRAPPGVKRPHGPTSHRPASTGTEQSPQARRRAPWGTSQSPSHPKGARGINPPNSAPPPARRAALSRRPLAPPAHAVLSRRPLAPPTRAVRSRRPLAPPSRTALSRRRPAGAAVFCIFVVAQFAF